MKVCVADTHSLIWYLQDNPRLSHRGRLLFSQADNGKASIVIPTIVLVEMTYLAEKKRIANELVKAALNLLRETSENYRLALLDLAVVEIIGQVSRALVPDMPDRIIAATALSLGLPLLTRDRALVAVEESDGTNIGPGAKREQPIGERAVLRWRFCFGLPGRNLESKLRKKWTRRL
ncbi:MAG TPA: PIN domain-containing protein [Anaerolineae bacterium]|nr:PIN domain-containing protein [Anaerolineae bacterium]